LTKPSAGEKVPLKAVEILREKRRGRGLGDRAIARLEG
jgi:hypothetical protein